MKLFWKTTLVIIFMILAVNCKTKEANTNVNLSLNADITTKLKERVNKEIEKEFDSKFLSRGELVIKKKEVLIFDFNEDDLLDGVAFLSFFSATDNSFKRSIIMYYKNDGKQLILKDKIKKDYCVFPEKDAIKNIQFEAALKIYASQVKPNELGLIDESLKQESIISLADDKLIYGEVISSDHYDVNNSHKVEQESYYKYTSAESGLIYRDKPDGKVLGNFPYGKEVHVIGKTGLKKTIYDQGKEVEGEWVEVALDEYSEKKAFVFDGYLKEIHELDRQKLIKVAPVVFEKNRKKGLILPGTYKVFNQKLKHTSDITLDGISEVYVIKKTKYKRPLQSNQKYCEWANYVEVILAREHFILFGENIISISSSEEIKLSENKKVALVLGENYTMGASDEDGLTGCDDYSNVFLKTGNRYEVLYHKPEKVEDKLVAKVFVHDEGMGERISEIKVEDNTILLYIAQGFQEGTGSYKMKIFKQDKWYCTETDHKREY